MPRVNLKFLHQLSQLAINPPDYLRIAQQKFTSSGRSGVLSFATDGVHKLSVEAPDGTTRKFGAVGHGDYIIYRALENIGRVPSGLAEQKRHTYRTSHLAMTGWWKRDP